MELNHLIIFLFLLNFFKGKENDLELNSYQKLNHIEMIYTNRSFIINTNETSIAFFDSFDFGSIIYISKDINEFNTQNDKRITGQFVIIEQNVTYYVRIYLINSNLISNLRQYLYPENLLEKSISIKGKELSFLYLKKDKNYSLDFKENTINKRIIKLSTKTLNSKIIINNETELNKTNLYYELENNFKGILKLEIRDNDSFIEFLSSEENFDIFTNISLTNYEVKKNTNVIIIEKTQKNFELKLYSDKPFDFSLSYGLSNNQEFFYDNSINTLSPGQIKGSFIYQHTLYGPYKNIILTEKEFISFTVKVKISEGQKLFIDYRQDSLISPILDEKMEQKDCENIIKYLIEMFDLYIFTDIAKNPPIIKDIDNYHHRKIDIKKELSNIKTNNRYFYEFYQEVMAIISTLRDYHLNIHANRTPKGIPFNKYEVIIPFDFIIKPDDNKEFKVFIQLKEIYKEYDEKIQKNLENCVNIPLKSINDMDPFDFIQTFSKFETAKNKHSQFTLTINNIINRFKLTTSPLNAYDFLYNDYEFENNIYLRIFSYVYFPKINDIEFNYFFDNYIKSKQKEQMNDFEYPSFEEMKEKYLIYKGIKKEIKFEAEEEKIKWNITLYNKNDKSKYMKCRVDYENEVNVVVQTSFKFDTNLGTFKIIQCAKLFHSNNYPIIIIESLNGGGNGHLYMTMHQLFQIRTVDRSYFSYRMTDISKNLKSKINYFNTAAKDCRRIRSFKDLNEVTDYYNYNNESIEHKRSEAIDPHEFYNRELLRRFREEYKDNKNLKKPTDIIIFSDAFSFSATCGLIKGFQNTGGAIIVGYFGNPKLNGTDMFDGCQSISQVEEIENMDLYKNLEELGIIIEQITTGEAFDDSVYGPNPIPREYAFNPVDYRVDIYSKYSDDNYKDFINYGKKIHEKFNKKNYCNPKNEKLLFHSDNCTIKGKEHAHGGYSCNSNTSRWNTEDCQPYYCDMGYYYNQYEKKCMEECTFNDIIHYLISDELKDKKFDIEKDKMAFLTFINEESNNYYFYNSSEDIAYGNIPKIGFVHMGTYLFNEEKNLSKNFEIKVTKLTSDAKFSQYKVDTKKEDFIELSTGKDLKFLQLSDDHIFYVYNTFNYKENKIKLAQYNDEIKLDEILEGSDKYFKTYNNEDGFITLPKNEINIILMDYSKKDQIHYLIAPKNVTENIIITNKNTNFLYLQENKQYELDFKDNQINRMIKLSRKTINSTIVIKDENIILDSNNIYYKIKDEFKGKIKLEIKNNDALIEFLFKIDGVNIMDFGKSFNYNTTSKYNMITVSREYFSKILEFKIKGGKNFNFNIFFGYSIPPYTYYNFANLNQFNPQLNEENISITIDEIKLMNGEYYCVFFENLGDYLSMSFSEKEKEDKDKKREDDKEAKAKGLEIWEIILIIVSSILALIIAIIIIIHCHRKKIKLSDIKIEEKMENLTKII